MVPVSTSTLSELSDGFALALEEADADALVELFAPDGTLEVAAAFAAVGTARIREETHASLRRSGQLKLERLTTTIDDDQARPTVGVTMSLADGISVGPLPQRCGSSAGVTVGTIGCEC